MSNAGSESCGPVNSEDLPFFEDEIEISSNQLQLHPVSAVKPLDPMISGLAGTNSLDGKNALVRAVKTTGSSPDRGMRQLAKQVSSLKATALDNKKTILNLVGSISRLRRMVMGSDTDGVLSKKLQQGNHSPASASPYTVQVRSSKETLKTPGLFRCARLKWIGGGGKPSYVSCNYVGMTLSLYKDHLRKVPHKNIAISKVKRADGIIIYRCRNRTIKGNVCKCTSKKVGKVSRHAQYIPHLETIKVTGRVCVLCNTSFESSLKLAAHCFQNSHCGK